MSPQQMHNIGYYNYVEKVKVYGSNLQLGMYVCELDRPWREAPFGVHGFEIKNSEELGVLKQLCKYAYIDVLRSQLDEVTFECSPEFPFQASSKLPSVLNGVRAVDNVVEFNLSLVNRFIKDIRNGTSIDIQLAKEGVSESVASILRNPNAVFLMSQMREKDELISQHALNTCVYSIIVGRMAGFEPRQLEDLGMCGFLHDVGKIAIPNETVRKTGPLSVDELAVLRQHAERGRDILVSGNKVFDSAVDVAYAHHEHLDGSGYPRGLKRADLSLPCRIVAVVERYDALVTPRYHRPAHTHLDAVMILNEMAKQNQLDQKIVASFVTHLGVYPPGSIVELNTGEKAIVVETNPTERLLPRILVVRDPDQNPVARFVDMALLKTDSDRRKYRIKAVHRAHAFGIKLRDYRSAVRNLVRGFY